MRVENMVGALTSYQSLRVKGSILKIIKKHQTSTSSTSQLLRLCSRCELKCNAVAPNFQKSYKFALYTLNKCILPFVCIGNMRNLRKFEPYEHVCDRARYIVISAILAKKLDSKRKLIERTYIYVKLNYLHLFFEAFFTSFRETLILAYRHD